MQISKGTKGNLYLATELLSLKIKLKIFSVLLLFINNARFFLRLAVSTWEDRIVARYLFLVAACSFCCHSSVELFTAREVLMGTNRAEVHSGRSFYLRTG